MTIIVPDWIGITGKMNAGKTTVAGIIKEHLRDKVPTCIIPFAAPIKRLALDMGWNGEKDDKGRRLLQLLGTECGRQCIAPDIWIRRWYEQAERWWLRDNEPERLVVIADDLRFDNEAEWILDHGGIVVLVDRPGQMEMRCSECVDHASEQSLSPGLTTFMISNMKDVFDLQRSTLTFLNELQHIYKESNVASFKGRDVHQKLRRLIPSWRSW